MRRATRQRGHSPVPQSGSQPYDLDKLTAGASKYFERIGSETIQRINAEFATRRKQFKKAKLRWRASRGSRRALGLDSLQGGAAEA